MGKEQLLTFLKTKCKGKENQVKGVLLQRTFSISGTTLQSWVSQLRQDGELICSDACGYYYAASGWDVCETMERIQRTINTLQKDNLGLKRGLRDCFVIDGGRDG